MRIRKRRTRREKYIIIVFNTQSTTLVTRKAKEEKKKKKKDEKGMENREKKITQPPYRHYRYCHHHSLMHIHPADLCADDPVRLRFEGLNLVVPIHAEAKGGGLARAIGNQSAVQVSIFTLQKVPQGPLFE